MEFSYNSKTKKYKLGETEYTEDEFIAYIKAGMLATALSKESSFEVVSSTTSSPHTPEQIIYYGVPGCGKSHEITQKLKNDFKIESEENQVMRTVFHPDYTNADFVGQIMPKINSDKTIEYCFVPGPFTKILTRALRDSKNKYVLIIEEINRGNAASIFGEIFQLLDRIKDGVTITEKVKDGSLNTFGKGWSEYFFMNDDINHYILNECNASESLETAHINGIAFSVNTGIRLPPNLSILATMNTSDQNVFTLDNAFQRRWDMQYISNSVTTEELNKDEAKKTQYNTKIGDTDVTWGKFRDVINKKIASSEFSFSNAEDKQLGLFFIQPKKRDAQSNDAQANTAEFLINESDFSNKVLKYLWLDVFKRDREEIFNSDIHTFGDLVEKFTGSDAFDNCFNDEFRSLL